jgi:hypothetical protein
MVERNDFWWLLNHVVVLFNTCRIDFTGCTRDYRCSTTLWLVEIVVFFGFENCGDFGKWGGFWVVANVTIFVETRLIASLRKRNATQIISNFHFPNTKIGQTGLLKTTTLTMKNIGVTQNDADDRIPNNSQIFKLLNL